MKIIFFEAGPTEEKSIRSELAKFDQFKSTEISFVAERLTLDNADAAKDADVVSVFVKSEVNKSVIEKLSKAKLITTRSTGFDHIDGAFAKTRGITVENIPAYGSRTVAEYTFALILGLSRRTFAATGHVKLTLDLGLGGFMGFDLQGKTIGVVGTGRIGQNVAKIAKGFDMNVIAYDSFPNAEAASSIGFKYVSLDELLSSSDIVTLHVPNKPDTKHMINLENIGKFKKGALLINTARGEVCDSLAIIKGVEEKILSGVGLDVFEGERHVKDASQPEVGAMFEKLLSYPEIFVTPHIAFFTREAEHEIISVSTANIVAFLDGAMKNVVNS